ncbi:hypothetical protein DPMN_107401 [Dreissena polymorpha]|uniref:Uncharacterized protein n=1 Tax=Dreissena polymorpha TaxID=45954 RepID=A0A9D4K6P6_DREPO|nr:hypothetical protein DPMN_107401 [Dreissena polymorpha]
MQRIISNRLKSKAEELLAEEQLDSELGVLQWNRSSTSESSLRNKCNANVNSSTTSWTLRELLTACGMIAYGMLCEDFIIDEGMVQDNKELYENASSAVLLYGEQGGGLLQDIGGCPSGMSALSIVLFNFSLRT